MLVHIYRRLSITSSMIEKGYRKNCRVKTIAFDWTMAEKNWQMMPTLRSVRFDIINVHPADKLNHVVHVNHVFALPNFFLYRQCFLFFPIKIPCVAYDSHYVDSSTLNSAIISDEQKMQQEVIQSSHPGNSLIHSQSTTSIIPLEGLLSFFFF